MKTLVTLSDQKYHQGLAKVFKQLSKRMLKTYKRYGETQQSIDRIKEESLAISRAKLDMPSLIEAISPQIEDAKNNKGYYVFRIIHTESLRVALHVAPAGIKLPVHFHLNALNVLLLKQGAVKVTQLSSLDFDSSKNKKYLENDACSAGLRHYLNRHALETTGPVNLFFSIRREVPKPMRLMLACSLSLLLASSLYACPDSDDGMDSQEMMTQDALMTVAELVNLANWIRSSSQDDDNYLRAFELYLKAAKGNNAEAQYWLSMMYLKGMGVTDDDDEAFHWVSISAAQKYLPAIKLKHYLLTTDEALDC